MYSRRRDRSSSYFNGILNGPQAMTGRMVAAADGDLHEDLVISGGRGGQFDLDQGRFFEEGIGIHLGEVTLDEFKDSVSHVRLH